MATLPIDLTATLVPEKTTQLLSFIVQDELGVSISSAQLDSLTFTLFNWHAPTEILNSRNDVNILNANGGTVDTSGNGTLLLTPDDTSIPTGHAAENLLVACVLIEWTYGGGAKAGRQPILIKIINLDQVG